MANDRNNAAVMDSPTDARVHRPENIADLHRSGTNASSIPAVQVNNLKVYYDSEAGIVKAVDDVSFTLQQGERLALVGESGCGKTTLGMALLKLTKPPGYIDDGEIVIDGRDLVPLDDEEMRLARLAEVALVTQSAMNALNPVMRIEDQIFDGLDRSRNQGHQGELEVACSQPPPTRGVAKQRGKDVPARVKRWNETTGRYRVRHEHES